MKINKEGYKIITTSGIICLILWSLIYYFQSHHSGIGLHITSGVILVAFWFFIVAFFREPRRVKIHDSDLVFSPCDGRVVVTEVVYEDEYMKEEMLQISIFMSVTNIHMNWLPVSGVIDYYKYHPGKYLLAFLPKASELNEHSSMAIRNEHGEVFYKQLAGTFARRIICYANPGNKEVKGEQCGIIRFGSRIDMYLPLDAEIKVKMGEHVRACETVIAEL